MSSRAIAGSPGKALNWVIDLLAAFYFSVLFLVLIAWRLAGRRASPSR